MTVLPCWRKSGFKLFSGCCKGQFSCSFFILAWPLYVNWVGRLLWGFSHMRKVYGNIFLCWEPKITSYWLHIDSYFHIFFLNQSTVSQELSELSPSLILSKDLSLFFRNAEFFYLLHPQSTPHFTHLLKYLLIIKWIFIWINMYINIFLVVQDNMQK